MDPSRLTRPRPSWRGPRHRRRRVTPARAAVAAALAAALGLATAALAVALHLTGQVVTSRHAVTGLAGQLSALAGQVSALAGQVSALAGQVSDAQARAASAAAAASAASAAARHTPTAGVCVNVVYATAFGTTMVARVQVTPPVKGTAGPVSCPIGTFVPATPQPSPSPSPMMRGRD